MEGVSKTRKPAAERPHILAVTYPLMGHMTPLLQLCKILIAKAGFRVTIACNERAVVALYRLLPENHEDHHMQVLPISDGLPLDLGQFTWDTFRTLQHVPQEDLLRCFLQHIHNFSDVRCVISDVYLSWTQDVAKQLGVPRIAIWVAAAAEHQVYFHAKELIKAGKLPFKAPFGKDQAIDNMIPNLTGRLPAYHRVDWICEGEEEIKIPALPGLNRRDFPTFLQIEDASDVIFYSYIENIRTGLEASMVLFNPFEALEGNLLDTMRSQGIPAHPIGPLFLLEDLILKEQIQATEHRNEKTIDLQHDEEWLTWLDGQKPKSVMYIAFGTSATPIIADQMRELALGLLTSGQPFIWVYPKQIGSEVERGRPGLPEGFLDQVPDRGILLEWAPQKRILSHPSIGGFLSHCGWNSTVETLCSGVPILGLPRVSDQYLHCKMMVDVWKVGLRLERSRDEGIALAANVARLTQELLVGVEGDELQQRAQKWKAAAWRSVEAGGYSRCTLDAIMKLVMKG